MPGEEYWMNAGGWIVTAFVPGVIGLYIGWKLLSAFRKPTDPDEPEDEWK